jgi:hypothetical protein
MTAEGSESVPRTALSLKYSSIFHAILEMAWHDAIR